MTDVVRPNVGVLGESDHFSSPQMLTPSLDQLAGRSLVLTNAYTQVALCGPSRSSFLTGRRADTTRCYVSEDKVRLSMPDIVTMPQYFKQNGYLALGTGKIFHPGGSTRSHTLTIINCFNTKDSRTPKRETTTPPPGAKRFSTQHQPT